MKLSYNAEGKFYHLHLCCCQNWSFAKSAFGLLYTN